jgi:uncharacterized membrane protein HdeD (DUF308 family)
MPDAEPAGSGPEPYHRPGRRHRPAVRTPSGGEVTTTSVSAASAAPGAALARRTWLIALRGVAALVFAALAFGWPRPTLAVVVLLFGAYVLIDGVLDGIAAVAAFRARQRWWPAALEALVGVGIGLGAAGLILTGSGARFLPYLVAAWAIANGLLRVYAAFELRRYVGVEWTTLAVGVLFIATGLLVAAEPDRGALAALWLLAAGALVYGVYSLFQAYRWHRLRRRLAAPPSGPGGSG